MLVQTVNCTKCGAMIALNDRYCYRCGTRQPSDSGAQRLQKLRIGAKHPPEEIMEQFKKIRELYTSGKIDEENYAKIVSSTILVDEKGNNWSISADDLKWFRNENGDWILDEPKGDLSISVKKVN